jgi:uncharacterized membrane protein
MQNHKKTLFIVQAGIIAALYIVLTMLAWGFDLASGAIQVRFSEMLCILPFFTPAAIPGVTIGCLLSNIIMGSAMPDVIFGTLATLIGALGTFALRRNRWLCALPPILANAVIIPLVLIFAYHLTDAYWFLALTVGAGEVIAILIFGEILLSALKPFRQKIFGTSESVSSADFQKAAPAGK